MEESRFGLASKRSRTGCVACRQKKLRCDEQRPVCSRCNSKGDTCVYQPKIPLRERRSGLGPGQHSPWSFEGTHVSIDSPSRTRRTVSSSTDKLVQIPLISKPWHSGLGDSLDPFDTLPIKMPFKSTELLRYFFQAGQACASAQATMGNGLTMVTSNPDLLRNVLLISGLHYAWSTGNLQLFESTFLFHKIQSIRQVNSWLQSSEHAKDRMICASYINTLCFIECCLGNFAIADSHLNGLMVYLDATRRSLDKESTTSNEVEAELIDRYFILVCNFVHSQKSRVDDFLRSHDTVSSPFDSKDAFDMIHKWHIEEETGPEFRLRTVSMMPFFFTPVTLDKMPGDIDARPIINALQHTTYLHGLRYRRALADVVTSATWKVWNSGSALKLFFAIINGHMQLFSDDVQPPSDESQPDEVQPIPSSWSGLCVGVGMYLATVLGMSNRGLPPDTRLHYHTLNILKRDLERGLRSLDKMSKEGQYLWFWKAFTGSLSLMHARSLTHTQQLDELFMKFTNFLRIWVERSGVTQWAEARTILMRTAWPANSNQDGLMLSLWQIYAATGRSI